jgi:heptaprenyl diphosphate synthase
MILRSNKIAILGLLSAFAIIISYIETLIPINIAIPGIKMGFSNIVIVVALYRYGVKEAGIINFIRIFIVGIMFGNVMSILFSILGAVTSLISMWFAKKIKGISMVGVSVCGGVAHNIGQILAAMFITTVYSLTYYIPFLIVGGIITGVIVGIVANIINGRIVCEEGI